MLDFPTRDAYDNFFQFWRLRDGVALSFKIGKGTCQASALVPIVEYMTSCDCHRIHRCDAEDIVDSVINGVILYACESRIDAAASDAGETWKTAEFI